MRLMRLALIVLGSIAVASSNAAYAANGQAVTSAHPQTTLRPIPPDLARREVSMRALLQPSVKGWVDARASSYAGKPAPDIKALRAAIRRRSACRAFEKLSVLLRAATREAERPGSQGFLDNPNLGPRLTAA